MVISVIISCNRKLFLVMTSRMLWHLFLFLEKCPALLVMTPLLESVYAIAYTSLSFTLVDTYSFSHCVPPLFTIPEIFYSLCVTSKIL